MVIVFVVPEFLTKNKASTGLPNYIFRVSKALISMGHEPIVITAGKNNENIQYKGIRVIRRKVNLGYFEKYRSLNYIINVISMNRILTKELNELIKQEKISIIQFCSLYGLGIFYRGKVPAVMRLSSYSKKYFMYSNSYSKLFINIMGSVERLSARNRQGIISPSNVMAEAFAKDIHKQVDVIETPFVDDTEHLDYSVYEKYLLYKKYVLFFGTLYEEKGIYVIAKIIKQFLEKNREYYFVFIGDIQKKRDINPMQLICQNAGKYKKRVIYIKPLCHEKLYPIIKNSDLVILPSIMDNLPNACIEAMYLGKVVIGTRGTSFEQLIADGKSGYLAVPNDAKSLYRKVALAIQLNEQKKQEMGERARARIKQLQPQTVVKQLVDYYENIIKDVETDNV